MAAMAIMLSLGCQLVCRIFFVKSKLSTLTSSLYDDDDFVALFRAFVLRLEFMDGDALPPLFVGLCPFVKLPFITRLGFRSWRGLLCSLEHSNINSCLVVRLKDLKKLLYDPLRMWLNKRKHIYYGILKKSWKILIKIWSFLSSIILKNNYIFYGLGRVWPKSRVLDWNMSSYFFAQESRK